MVGDTTNDDSTNRPKHLQHLRCWRSEPHRHDFRAVSRRIRNEDTPRNTLQNLRRQKHALRVAEVEDEDESVQGHQAADGSPSVSDCGCDGAGEEAADEGTNRTGALEGRLPGGDDDVFTWGDGGRDAEISRELSGGYELAHEEDAVGFHNLFLLLISIMCSTYLSTILTIVQDMTNAHQEAAG